MLFVRRIKRTSKIKTKIKRWRMTPQVTDNVYNGYLSQEHSEMYWLSNQYKKYVKLPVISTEDVCNEIGGVEKLAEIIGKDFCYPHLDMKQTIRLIRWKTDMGLYQR